MSCTLRGGFDVAKDILRYQHNGTNICVRRYWNKTQLLLDDVVVDTWKGIVEIAYALQGNIEEDRIVVRVTPAAVGANIQLTVNGDPVKRSWKM